MTLRYYICPVVGTGTRADPYRTGASLHDVASASVIPSRADGAPAFPWCLTLVDAADHAPLLADVALTPLPALKHAEAWSSAKADESAKVAVEAVKLGVVIPDAGDFREVVRRIGAALDRKFDERALWVNAPHE